MLLSLILFCAFFLLEMTSQIDFIINRFLPEDPHDAKYLRKRLGLTEETPLIFVSDQNDYARFAEMERTTLLQFKSQEYINGISEIAMTLFELSGIEGNVEVRMKKWIPFAKR